MAAKSRDGHRRRKGIRKGVADPASRIDGRRLGSRKPVLVHARAGESGLGRVGVTAARADGANLRGDGDVRGGSLESREQLLRSRSWRGIPIAAGPGGPPKRLGVVKTRRHRSHGRKLDGAGRRSKKWVLEIETCRWHPSVVRISGEAQSAARSEAVHLAEKEPGASLTGAFGGVR